jgi:hypothetical protein
MTKDEALKLALEALGWTDEWRPQGLKEDAITAIKAALEAKDEPVGDFYITKAMAKHIKNLEVNWNICTSGSKKPTDKKVVPVFVGDTTPPQRTWVGLTEKDICEAAVKSQEGISPRDDTLRFAIAIEAKLKQKNGNA